MFQIKWKHLLNQYIKQIFICLLILVIVLLIIFLGLLVKTLEESYNQFVHTVLSYAK